MKFVPTETKSVFTKNYKNYIFQAQMGVACIIWIKIVQETHCASIVLIPPHGSCVISQSVVMLLDDVLMI